MAIGFGGIAPARVSAATPPADHLIQRVNARRFELQFRVSEGAKPLSAVELWFSTDRGKTWRFYGPVPPESRSVAFTAPEEGLFAFFFVLENALGRNTPSGGPPDEFAEPAHWAFIDDHPPLLQPDAAILDAGFAANRVVHIRWTLYDDHPLPRPIVLTYRLGGQRVWFPLAPRMANIGRFDWTVPHDLAGEVVIRVSAQDRGGNETTREFDPILLPAAGLVSSRSPEDETRADSPESVSLAGEGLTAISMDTAEPAEQPLPGSALGPDEQVVPPQAAPDPVLLESRSSPEQLRRLAQWHLERGQYELAVLRLREALQFDPDFTPAMQDLAQAYTATGDFRAAVEVYDQLLLAVPDDASVLFGKALAQAGGREYLLAERTLRSLLETHPKIAAAWLELGDLALMLGDRDEAMDCWRRAATVDERDADSIRRARSRLAEFPESGAMRHGQGNRPRGAPHEADLRHLRR